MAWAEEVERTASDEEQAKALVAIRGFTRETPPTLWDRKTDYERVLASFGGSHVECARALRTLEKQRRIKWTNSGRISLLDEQSEGSPRVFVPTEVYERTVAGVMRPTDTAEIAQEVHTVDAPVLNTPQPPTSLSEAVDAVRDNIRDDEEPF